MFQSVFTRWVVSVLLSVGMTINGSLGHGAEPSSLQGQQRTSPKSLQVHDVELAEGGVLTGQLVGKTGNPISGETVYLADSKQILATTKTHEDGSFQLRGLAGGNYGIGSRQATSLVRLWSAGTAPPVATKQTLLVASEKTVRSQFGGISDGLFRYDEAIGLLGIPLLVIGAAIIIQQYRGEQYSGTP